MTAFTFPNLYNNPVEDFDWYIADIDNIPIATELQSRTPKTLG